MRRKRSLEDWILDSIITVILIVIAFISLYPFYYILLITVNAGTDTTIGGMYLWPRKISLDNYIYFFEDSQWIKAFVVTVLRTVVGTILSISFTSMVAYGFAKRDLIFRKTYFFLVVVAMNFSGGIIAYYIVLRSLGIINSFAVYVIPGMLNTFFLLIAISLFREASALRGELIYAQHGPH